MKYYELREARQILKVKRDVTLLATLASCLNPESREIGEGMARNMKQLGETILAEFGDVANESEQ